MDCPRKELRAWREVLKREPCVYCGQSLSELRAGRTPRAAKPLMTIDHIQPRGKRAHRRHHWDNEAPACWNCNHAKGSRPFLFFLVRRLELERQRDRKCRWHTVVARLKREGTWHDGLQPADFGL